MKISDAEYNRRQLAKVDLDCPVFPEINGRILVSMYSPNRTGRMIIRKGVIINSSVEANPTGGRQTVFMFMDDGAEIVLDTEAGMSNVTIAAATRVYIGKRAFLGAGVCIFDTDFHSLHDAERLPDNVGIVTRPVHIGDRAFVGAFAIILKGVTIGEDSVIGAGSVVARSIPPGEIWAGNPARFIKKLPPYEKRRAPKFIRPVPPNGSA
jgi:acetyltransferase-like isoleucine patch superfamily enzyme